MSVEVQLSLSDQQIREIVADAGPTALRDNPVVLAVIRAADELLECTDPEYRWVHEDELRKQIRRIR